MAEAKEAMKVFVTGGAESAGLSTVKALLRRGHKVVATACDAESALVLRQAGALPVYPDIGRASELLSTLRFAEADALVHAGPQICGGLPHASDDCAMHSEELVACTEAVVEAAREHAVKRVVSLSFGYLYESGRGTSKEGAPDVHDKACAPMLRAEAILRESALRGFIIRGGCIYGGSSPSTAALADMIKRSRQLPAGNQPMSWIHEDDLAAAVVALLEAEAPVDGIETLNAADGSPRSPNAFAEAMCAVLGLNDVDFASDGPLSVLRKKNFRDRMLEREIVINSDSLRERFGWSPRHSDIESGLEATALVWRMKDAVNPDDFYNAYDDKATEAIAAFAYEVALPEAVAEEAKPSAPTEAAAQPPPSVERKAPPPSDGPTPWNEDEAKREERKRRALERKAKRAARQASRN